MFRRFGKWILTLILFALAVFAAGIYLILFQPPEDRFVATGGKVFSQATETVHLTAPAEANGVFDETVLMAADTGSLVFTGGICYSAPFENGYAKICRLEYLTGENHVMTLLSVNPAHAAVLFSDGQLLTAAGPEIANQKSVRMQKEGAVQLILNGKTCAYLVEADDRETEEGLNAARIFIR